jgi:hypothetical protein
MRAEERSEGAGAVGGRRCCRRHHRRHGSGACAEPGNTPDAAARDPDYAAGKQALERKDWHGSPALCQATLRDPGNADLHNYLGFSYRISGGSIRLQALQARPS